MQYNLSELITEYNKIFEDGWPGWDLMQIYTEARLVEVAKECIEKKQDVYKLNYLERLPDDILT